MVRDLTAETLAQIETRRPQSADDIRDAPYPVVRFSEGMVAQMAELRKFLFQEFYFHPRVKNAMDGARKIVSDLFKYFLAHPEALPEDWRQSAASTDRGRVIGDFVAGMTDRLALDTHRRLFDDTPRMR
jgi:dGTPase